TVGTGALSAEGDCNCGPLQIMNWARLKAALPPRGERTMLDSRRSEREETMSNKAAAGLAAGVALIATVLLNSSGLRAQAPAAAPPAPIMPPSLPATHVVDLMTAEGSAAFGAQWKVSDVRIVEVPAIPDTATAFKTTYNVEPRAGAASFDDSKWQ